MPKGKTTVIYTGEFKQEVIETMRKEHLGFNEAERRFGVSHERISRWERIYLEEGVAGLYIEHRGKSSKGRPKVLDKKVEDDLIAENQRLRMENDYLKKLNALVQEREQRERKPR